MSGAEESEWIRMDDAGFIALVGPLYYLPFRDSVGRFRLVSGAKHRIEGDAVSNGLLMTFADRSLGTTARQADMERRQATVQLDVHFVGSARVGETIDMECRIVREVGSLVFVEGAISVAGEVVATAKGVWKVLAGQGPRRT